MVVEDPSDCSIRPPDHVTRTDALKLIRRLSASITTPTFMYLDPPYVNKGSSLYENHYSADDHADIARVLRYEVPHPWVVSYDLCPTVKRLYEGLQFLTYSLRYSANERRAGREIIVFGPTVQKPKHRNPLAVRPSGLRIARSV